MVIVPTHSHYDMAERYCLCCHNHNHSCCCDHYCLVRRAVAVDISFIPIVSIISFVPFIIVTVVSVMIATITVTAKKTSASSSATCKGHFLKDIQV